MDNMLPSVLTIAGSDSGGGAGIQTDLRTFYFFKVYGNSVITAVTAQNPLEVRRIDILPAEAVKCQLETVLDAFPVRFAKTGMLASREIVECVAETVQKRKIALIIDPVMVSTSGAKLLEESAVSALQEKLFPLAQWLTPNIPEAELLCRRKLETPAALADAALSLYNRYRCNIILKSGHAVSGNDVADIICHEGKLFTLSSPRAAVTGNTAHGTGCTLSAALAANLALQKNWQDALITAKAFVYGSLCENRNLNGTLSQMFPPEKNYFKQVVLQEL